MLVGMCGWLVIAFWRSNDQPLQDISLIGMKISITMLMFPLLMYLSSSFVLRQKQKLLSSQDGLEVVAYFELGLFSIFGLSWSALFFFRMMVLKVCKHV
jgi:hypothetical protein